MTITAEIGHKMYALKNIEQAQQLLSILDSAIVVDEQMCRQDGEYEHYLVKCQSGPRIEVKLTQTEIIEKNEFDEICKKHEVTTPV